MRRLKTTVFVMCCGASAAIASGPPVTPISALERDRMVTVQGTVERITDEDEFRLADASGTVRVYVGPNWVPAHEGEWVTVVGMVDDGFGPLEIYAQSLTRPGGTTYTFEYDYE